VTSAADELPASPRETRRQALLARGRSQTANPLLRSAYSLAVNSALTAGLGMAFWVAAARLYPSSSVGRDSALIAAMVQISTIAQLNLSNALVRFMPGSAMAARLLVGSYVASAIAACALGTAFVLAAPHVSDQFAFLTDEPLTAAAYVAAVVLWGVFALQDAALTATRQAPLVPIENGLFGILKLAALPVLLAMGIAHGPLIAWAVPMCVLLLPVNWLLFGRILRREPVGRSAGVLPFGGRRLVTFLALDYLSTVFIQTSLTVLPLIVIGTLGTRANAHFYVAFAVAIAVDSMSYSVTSALVAEGALAPERVPELVRLLVRRMALFAVPLVAALVVAAPLVMLPFGPEYERESTTVLRILLLGSLCRSAVVLAAAILRLEGSAGRIAVLDGCLLLGLLAAAVPLAHVWGITGVALAWLGSAMVMGAAVLPLLIRSVRAPASAS
jgi:O-antigen/teichoic acid export membrane protein